ncbi:bifunctional diaminohydroxyphosphoribosylaminopyrimidine deaminase/5-amino-6-(5-phosphoribosylamino)uracil reductase RibD [Flavobacteriaceae bacterium TP-CH-4]|uniref:Riboflavin biosynthesis protein RibD n=2 Tax=Pelagihabitans pacificus TaxID=2696054 RepID=A0A967AS73_9FLAO|nr:bifunctional diaminohydroxyphosphoribosylaminopyrimidine deaminase/5-amino-6-(5-phosphoribosylamino)uracil reductase RibD [Pelagihabitans pacificus]
MRRCIEIAKNGLGTSAPNPMVGAVIVNGERIIGEGFTSPYGGPHAEVNAIQSVKEGSLLSSSTLYVTLEPCSHFGKTPPCADLIVNSRIPKVVVGLMDPNPKVAGKGIQRLRDSECQVTVGVLETECREHHKRFLTFHEKKRPLIILKWAMTADGFIAPESKKRTQAPQPYWITNPSSRQLVHQWRSEEQAILVGTNTVLQDNPRLDIRQWTGKNPMRVILDQDLKIDGNFHVLDGNIPTLVLTAIADSSKYINGINYELLDFSKEIAPQICDVLHRYEINSVLIEGGTQTLTTFIKAGLWDEARVFTGKSRFTKGIEGPSLKATLLNSIRIDTDILNLYGND